MPGNGTFNLSRLWRALGVKNPQDSLSERVQPVIVVGQFGYLTPQFAPAMAMFGGDVAGAIGEFSMMALTSRSPGGTLITSFGPVALFYGIGARPANVISAIPQTGATYSNEDFVSVVERGTDPVFPFPAGIDRVVAAPPTNAVSMLPGAPLWIPPGRSFLIVSGTTNTVINNVWIQAIDIAAAENPAA